MIIIDITDVLFITALISTAFVDLMTVDIRLFVGDFLLVHDFLWLIARSGRLTERDADLVA